MSDTTIVIKAKDSTKKAFASVNKGLGKVRTGINSTQLKVGVLAGVAGFGAIVKSSLAAGDALAKSSDKIGIATEKLGALHHITSLYTSAGVGAMDEALTKATKRLGEFNATGGGAAARWLEKLSLDTEHLASLKPDELFNTYAESIRGLSSRGEQLAAISALMGDESRQLIGIVDESAESLAAAAKEAEVFGIALTRIDAAKMEAANDSFTRISAITEGFGNQLTAEIAPLLEATANLWVDNAKAAGGFGNVAMDVVDSLVTGIGFVGDVFRGWQLIWASLETSFFGLSSAILGGLNSLQNGMVGFINSIPGVDITPFEELNQLANEMETEFLDAQVALYDLVAIPLPSEEFKQWSQEVRQQAQLAAEEVARTKAAIGGTNVASFNVDTGGADVGAMRFDDASMEAELTAAIALEDQLDALYDERATARLEREQENANMWDMIWANSINNFATGMGNAVADVMVDQKNMSEALQALMKSVAKQVISSLVEIGVKRAIMALTAQAQEKAIVLSGVASAGTLAAAYAPAAAAASLASFGANSGPAMAGISATHALSESLAIAGQAHDGLDNVPGEGTYLLQKGEMVLDPGTSQQVRDNVTNNQSSKSIVNEVNVTVIANDANSFEEQQLRSKDNIWNIIVDRMTEEGLSFA